MKAGQIVAQRKIEIVDVPMPEMEDDQVRFKVEHACLCGSDSPMFNYDFNERRAAKYLTNDIYIDYEKESLYPLPPGLSLHECVGTVTESTSEKYKVGDFVLGVPIMQYGFFEYLTLPEDRIYPMPRGPVSNQEILMSQPLGTILFGFRKLPEIRDKNVVVIGQGPMGVLMNAALKMRGAAQIIAIDKYDYRLRVGEQMGSTGDINNSERDPKSIVETLTDGEGADIVIEVAGHHELAIELAIDLVRHDGHVMQFGVTDIDHVDHFPLGKFFYKNVTLHNSVGAFYEKDFVEASRLIAEGIIDVKPLLTHTFKLDQAQEAFETFVDRADGAIKVLLDFS